jgi:hypothetical protein
VEKIKEYFLKKSDLKDVRLWYMHACVLGKDLAQTVRGVWTEEI